MAKILLVCGKICCGKTTYSQKICEENNAVLLSVDEITLEVLGGNLGENHDEYVKKVKQYLLKKCVGAIHESPINVCRNFAGDQWSPLQARFKRARQIPICQCNYLK